LLGVCSVPLTFVTMEGQRWSVEGVQGETLLETIRRFDVPVPGHNTRRQRGEEGEGREGGQKERQRSAMQHRRENR